jgi:hypothetical protein
MKRLTCVGVERIVYRNRTEEPLKDLLLNVFINAFSNPDDAPVFGEFRERVYALGEDYGRFYATNVTVDGKAARYAMSGTTLSIDFPEALPPGARADVSILFEARIPRINHRIGSDGVSAWFGGFFPTVCVREGGRWAAEPYSPAGNPYYGAASNWAVNVVTTKDYTVTGTGEEMTQDGADRRTTTLTARMARGFAFAVSPAYRLDTLKTPGGVYINFYHYSDTDTSAALVAAADAFGRLSALAGAYPFVSYDIVETGLFRAGTESYAGVTFIDTEFVKGGFAAPSAASGVAAQFFGSIVGTNRADEPWLADGLAAFAASMARHGADEALDSQERLDYETVSARLNKAPHSRLGAPLSYYTDWGTYEAVSRGKGMLMCYALRKTIGAENFGVFLRTFYSNYSFKRAAAEDFKRLAHEIYGKPLDGFFSKWIDGDGLPEL